MKFIYIVICIFLSIAFGGFGYYIATRVQKHNLAREIALSALISARIYEGFSDSLHRIAATNDKVNVEELAAGAKYLNKQYLDIWSVYSSILTDSERKAIESIAKSNASSITASKMR